MNVFPAMRGKMGRWTYFVIKMSMRELAENVKFASDIYEDRTLDDAIQRVLNTSRVKKEIVTYLQRQPDRFFSSLVVAAIGGEPKWFPVEITDDERFTLLRQDDRMNSTFGVLTFDGTQDYYALDGQHRLAAIKSLIDRDSDEWREAPEGFASEEISVIVVAPSDEEGKERFFRRYRRLFGHLNRYAKSMDQVTNIIMDEDDVFAILTRRLITDHPFFQAAGPHKESYRIKTKKGKNVRSGDSYFTSLEALYQLNIELLASQRRRNDEWRDLKLYRRFRPEDDTIDALYEELAAVWDALRVVLPDLKEDPTKMRIHNPDDEGEKDSALFWPITQIIVARLARRLLDRDGQASVVEGLEPLQAIDYGLHNPPWRHLVLIPDSRGGWRMRSEDRKASVDLVERILWWQVGLTPLGAEEANRLREDWRALLVPSLDEAEEGQLWGEIAALAAANR